MKKKGIILIITCLLCVTLFAGCKDAVSDDLINYQNNQMDQVNKLYNKLSNDYTTVMGDKKMSDQEIAMKLKTVLVPEANELCKKAKAVKPTTEEVKNLHNKYIKSVTEKRDAIVLLDKSVSTNNDKLFTTINKKIDDSLKLSQEYDKDFNALEKKHHIEEDKDNK